MDKYVHGKLYKVIAVFIVIELLVIRLKGFPSSIGNFNATT